MKVSKYSFLIMSLSAATVLFPYSMANAGLRINNSSLMKNQAQMNAEYAAAAASTQAPQPARVITNENGESVSVSAENMNACNSIYPNGQFDWARPNVGTQRGAPATCVAFVELRAYPQNGTSYSNASGGNNYTVLATAYLAAGDSMRCNIDSFPNITLAGRDYVYPADSEPTIQDVEKVMAQENKSNAGWKILGATLVGGIGGNLVGKGEVGSDSPLGLNKEKLKSTAIGAVGAAALMTASTQVNDYKAGSVILSTGVSAAAGATAGNLLASGDDVLRIDDCTIMIPNTDKTNEKGKYVPLATKCVYGTLNVGSVDSKIEEGIFYNYENKNTYQCSKETDEQGKDVPDKYKDCKQVNLINIDMDLDECKDKELSDEDCAAAIKKTKNAYKQSDDDKKELEKDEGGTFIPIKSAQRAGSSVGAMIPVSDKVANEFFGYDASKWKTLKEELRNQDGGVKIYSMRDGKEIKDADIDKFKVAKQSADDGTMVDFNNKARMKSTMIGAGSGAALGALSGASGADAAIAERYNAAVREYKDSLNSIACYTGNRFLSWYNSVAILPEMKVTE